MITVKTGRPILTMTLLSLALGLPVPAMAQATKAGWWIRVDTKKTEADGIGLLIGTSAKDRRELKPWHNKDAAEFDLPADLAQAAVLHLRAIAIPDDEDVWFCVYFKGQGVRHFDFDTQAEATMKPTDQDGQCR